MGRAEDLLNGLQNTDANNEISLLIAGENTDTEPHFIINDNRVISVPSEFKTIAVQYDHNIETVTFDCPRYWDGHDMSKMVVYINYERADGETGAYLADNVRVDDEDESIMHFEWTISRNVTSASGSVTFLVCIKSVDKSGDEQEHWNSERCSDISVAPGLETGEPIEEKYPDVLTQLSDKVDDISKSNVTINDEESSTTSTYSSNKIDTLVGAKADKTQVDTLSGTVSELSAKVDSTAKINDAAIDTDSTYSSQKIESLVGAVDTKVGQTDTKVQGLETNISELSETVDSKADQSALTTLEGTVSTLQTTVGTKADQTDLDALETKVDGKPSINDTTASATSVYSSNKVDDLVEAVDTKVSSKADQSDLDTLEGTVSSLQTTVNNKADKSTVNAKQNKATVKTITINTSNWSSGVYTLSDSLITATSIQEWCLPVYTGSNAAEITALQAANIVDAGQSAGQAKIRCLGTVPTVTVHMVVIFWG